jgi:hypothetical protein
MKDDEIITEVRRNRARLFRECGGTLEGLFARLKELEKARERPVVKLPRRRPAKRTAKPA